MAITFKLMAAPSYDEYPDYDMRDSRIPLIQNVLDTLEQRKEFIAPVNKWPEKFAGCLQEPLGDRVIEVWLHNDQDYVDDIMECPDKAIACCKVIGGIIDPETYYLDQPTIFINMNSDILLGHVRDSVYGEPEFRDYYNCLHDWLISVTHEAGHALDFLQYGGGQTPQAIDDLYEAGDTDISMADCFSGANIDFPPSDDKADYDRMEARVERQGAEWLEDAQLTGHLTGNVIAEFAELYKQKYKLKPVSTSDFGM
jgi:hypothetical protein